MVKPVEGKVAKPKVTKPKVKEVPTTIPNVEEVVDQKPMTINDIPQELIAQIMSMVTQANAKVAEEKTNATKEVKEVVFTKAMLSTIEDEIVPVRSAINSVYFTSPRTRIEYAWEEKGDIENMSIKDVLALESKSKSFLRTPWLIVEDPRAVQALKLKDTYDLVEKVSDVDELILLDSEELKSIFNKLPNEYKKNFINEIYGKVKSRELNDLRIIDTLEEILKIDLKNI